MSVYFFIISYKFIQIFGSDQLRMLGVFYYLKLKSEFLAATYAAQIELPKLSREAKRRPALIDVHKELETDNPPEVCQTHVNTERSQLRQRIKWKGSAVRHEAGKGITIEVVPMSGIGGPIRIGVMRRDYLDSSPRLRDSVQLVNEAKDIRNMFDNVSTDDFIEFVVIKRIRKDSKIMNDVGVRARICIDAD